MCFIVPTGRASTLQWVAIASDSKWGFRMPLTGGCCSYPMERCAIKKCAFCTEEIQDEAIKQYFELIEDL
jgi:hypothetical protein